MKMTEVRESITKLVNEAVEAGKKVGACNAFLEMPDEDEPREYDAAEKYRAEADTRKQQLEFERDSGQRQIESTVSELHSLISRPNGHSWTQETYPYTFGHMVAIAVELKDRLGASIEVPERNYGSQGITLHSQGQEIIVSMTPWRHPANQFLDIAYVVLMVHDDSKPRTERDSWQYYFVSMMALNDLVDDRPQVKNLILQLEHFVRDSRLPEEQREYKSSSCNGAFGAWDGGVAMLPCSWSGDSHPIDRRWGQ
jgi:hypothetical protein